ncbi:MAG: adenosylmethionine decarboxylase [Alphaproteobacteria bacterium]|nr:adenosylmethionine decarboxylase [Alphaproteobacteria bacterium]
MARRASVANMVVSSGQERADATPLKAANTADYFIEKDGLAFAGLHILLDFWGCERLDDLEAIERALRTAVAAAGATLLNLHLHHFASSGGVSGVAVLAESHISIHTWPERGYAALDIFMCGSCDPYKAIPVLREAFQPTTVQLHEQRRGLTV